MKENIKILLKNACFAVAVAAFLLTGFIFVSAQNNAPKLSPEQWQADVRFLGDELPKLPRKITVKTLIRR